MVKKSTSLSLMMLQINLGDGPFSSNDRIVKKAPIDYKFTPVSFLDVLIKYGIPAKECLPFGANWTLITNQLNSQDNPHAISWLSTLIYSEWSLMYWFWSCNKLGYFDELKRGGMLDIFFENNKRFKPESKNHLNERQLDHKWWIDDLVIRIRAIWDKLPHALIECASPYKQLQSNKHSGRINELIEFKPKFEFSTKTTKLFEYLIDEIKDIGELKIHRDNELHKHTKRYAEILGENKKEAKSLYTSWNEISFELNRVREALMITVGLVLIRCGLLEY